MTERVKKRIMCKSVFNTPCPHNNNERCDYCRGINTQDGWKFRGCFYPPYKGKFVAEIKECPNKLQEGE